MSPFWLPLLPDFELELLLEDGAADDVVVVVAVCVSVALVVMVSPLKKMVEDVRLVVSVVDAEELCTGSMASIISLSFMTDLWEHPDIPRFPHVISLELLA